MLTLNQLKKKTNKYALLSAKVLGVLILLFVLFKVGIAVKEVFFPSPPPAPKTAFGVLPKVSFPKGNNTTEISYDLDTLTGELPTFPHLINVYEMKGYVPSLLDLENTQKVLTASEFLGQGTKLTDRQYAWTAKNGSRMTVDILTKDYALDIRVEEDEGEIKSEEEAINAADLFINRLFPPDDLNESKTTAVLYSLSDSQMLKAPSLSKSNLIAVNYYQKNINNLPIYYPGGSSSTMIVYVGKGESGAQIVGANFRHQYVGQDSSTYPLVSAQESYDMLRNGQGYIALNETGEKIVIKKVFLAYYIGEEKQEFLMPVVVFEGEDFLAYVPAVKAEWLGK